MTSLPPVALIHGMGSTFEHNWRETGWVDLLETEGREIIPVELPGHGSEPALNGEGDSAAQRLLERIGDGPVDAIGFSAGAAALYDAIVQRPEAFRCVSLLGLSDALIERRTTGIPELADELEHADESSSVMARLLAQMALGAGNDLTLVADYVRTMPPLPDFDSAASAQVPVLACLGDKEPTGADRLVAALPDARLLTLRRTDHFATPTSFQCQAAVLSFISTVGDEPC
ncbi:alpha/beta fold hydrolase [Janibacter limosus]|uniref:alpha/beta fold hydrolase n=1 Tax=Janibacter limosus TaxID=53458 RepID=UPI00082DEFE3|nr:alpha/beta hydrolase [Janibacter limosus]